MRIDMAANVVGASCIAMSRTRMYKRACVDAHVSACARVCAHVRAHGISGISILFRIYANPLNTQSFCIRFSPQILSFGTIFLFIFIAGDVAQSGAFDLRVKSKPLIVT